MDEGWNQEIIPHADALLCSGEASIAMIEAGSRAAALPEQVRALLSYGVERVDQATVPLRQ